MTKVVEEGHFSFTFPTDWVVEKVDDWAVRKSLADLSNANSFCSRCDNKLVCSYCGAKRPLGLKSADIIAIEPNKTCWIIEIKDYSEFPRTKIIDLADEVALKVRDTLVTLFVAKFNANNSDEKQIASSAVKCVNLRVILHLELPGTISYIRPAKITPTNVITRLKQLVKSIDPHPLVVSRTNMQSVPWSCDRLPH